MICDWGLEGHPASQPILNTSPEVGREPSGVTCHPHPLPAGTDSVKL